MYNLTGYKYQISRNEKAKYHGIKLTLYYSLVYNISVVD